MSGVPHSGVPSPAATTSFSGELLPGSPPNLPPPTRSTHSLLPLSKLPPPRKNGKQVSHHPHSFWDSNQGRGPRGFSPGSSGSGTAGSQSFCPRSAERPAKVPGPGSPDAWSCGVEKERGKDPEGRREAASTQQGPLSTLCKRPGPGSEARCPPQPADCTGSWPLRGL